MDFKERKKVYMGAIGGNKEKGEILFLYYSLE